jgi:hypothetical protein
MIHHTSRKKYRMTVSKLWLLGLLILMIVNTMHAEASDDSDDQNKNKKQTQYEKSALSPKTADLTAESYNSQNLVHATNGLKIKRETVPALEEKDFDKQGTKRTKTSNEGSYTKQTNIKSKSYRKKTDQNTSNFSAENLQTETNKEELSKMEKINHKVPNYEEKENYDTQNEKNDNEVPNPNNFRCLHGLKHFQICVLGFSCDTCGTSSPINSWMYGCRICNYDKCQNCLVPDQKREKQKPIENIHYQNPNKKLKTTEEFLSNPPRKNEKQNVDEAKELPKDYNSYEGKNVSDTMSGGCISITCPNWHLLSRINTSIAAVNMGFYCDWCGRFFPRGYTINRCHECDYDVCENCFAVHSNHKLRNLISQYLGFTKNWITFNKNVEEIKHNIGTQQLLMPIGMDHTPLKNPPEHMNSTDTDDMFFNAYVGVVPLDGDVAQMMKQSQYYTPTQVFYRFSDKTIIVKPIKYRNPDTLQDCETKTTCIPSLPFFLGQIKNGPSIFIHVNQIYKITFISYESPHMYVPRLEVDVDGHKYYLFDGSWLQYAY